MAVPAAMPAARPPGYPVHVDAVLDTPLSRWLWLVKWLLAIPHYVVLAFLWCAFVVTSVIAFFSILFTGVYPRAIFDFNVGVMRWSWRVTYYAYGALGTDRYPPFTLAEVPDYPAHLSVDYPQRLSRGLVLVKWWLLAIPHYIIVGLFVGGGTWLATRPDDDQWNWSWGGGGLVGILVLVAAVILAFTGTYPRSLYDVIVGMQRWALRVAGYAALMTDQYPPFRLDLGGSDPSTLALQAPPSGPQGLEAGETREPWAPGAPGTPGTPGTPETPGTPGAPGSPGALGSPGAPAGLTSHPGSWTAGRVVTLVVGAILAFASMGLLTGGIAVTAADHAARDDAGYLTSDVVALSSGRTAIVSDSLRLESGGPTWAYPSSVLGTARVRVTSTDPGRDVFVGVAPTSAIDSYLSGAGYTTVARVGGSTTTYVDHVGSATVTPPAQQRFWIASATGGGTQTLTWKPSSGDWTIVVMNADGTSAVNVQADVAATVPSLGWLSAGLLAAGALLLALGALLVTLPIRAATRHHHLEETRHPVTT